MGLFLSDDDLIELTGFVIASKQVNWLKCQGYYVETNARGKPRITHLQITERRQLSSTTPMTQKNSEPNLFKLKSIIGR